MREVVDIKLARNQTVKELIRQFDLSGGFTAKKLAAACEILNKMLFDKKCLKFLSFTANIVATGCRGVIRELAKRKLVDAIITTCGSLDHDLARCWKSYYQGDFTMDDAQLHRTKTHRLGNILIPFDSYGKILENKLQTVLKEIWRKQKKLSTKELIWELGKRIKNKNSIIYWCYRNKIPVFIPGIFDGALGSQLWLFWQEHKNFEIALFKDQQDLCELIFNAKRTGALIIGGGISKHHTIWWNQFRKGLDYAIYITTAVEWDGSLSGARTTEAISWGKIKEKAEHITVEGDATVLLPLMASAIFDLKWKKKN
ncbi:MAG: deoxyhypusine synthase [Candidatus Thermoplasmatota archaeon]|nr:deoxyhypusine synthase [Candidatus Thermoplasmatota archaeon]